MKQFDMAHVLGMFAKWAITLIVLGLSAALSYMFFVGIAPPDKPWFPYAAMGLTEGGFALWMITFMLTRHEPVHKGIAVVMAVACAIASFVVAGTELYLLLATKYDLASNASLYQVIAILLEVMFSLHILALLIDLLYSYFARPGNSFRTNGNLIPMQGNLIPSQNYRIQEGGSQELPLQIPYPSQDTVNKTFYQMGTVAKGAVSSATRKVKGFGKNGKTEGHVLGNQNETTDENM